MIDARVFRYGVKAAARAAATLAMIAVTGCLGGPDERQSGAVVPSLSGVYADFFPIGTAVQPRTLSSHNELIARHFTSLTAENHMKLHTIRPSSSRVDYSGADAVVDFAEAHGMMVRGHALIWHEAAPDWFFHDSGSRADPETIRRRLRDHITETVTRYRGRVYAWDVVNEGVSDSAGFLRDTIWLDALGPQYIADAFRWAHAADPDARLFYNDYSAIDPGKRERIVRLVNELRADGVPIHGVGIQGHWTLTWPPVSMIRDAIERYADLGLEVEITELDISFYDWEDRTTRYPALTDTMERRQAARYAEIFRVFREYSDVITNVTFWGVADDVSWLNYIPVQGRPNYPLLFDRAHREKQAFFAITDF